MLKTKPLNLKNKIILITRSLRVILYFGALLFIGLGLYKIITNFLSIKTETLKLQNEIHQRISTLEASKSSQENFNYDVIAKKSLFGNMTPVADNSSKKETPKVSDVALTLVGTYLNPGESPYAIIADKKTNSQEIFTLGQSVFSSADLVKILPDSVEIERKGKIEILILDDGTPREGSGSAATSSGDTIAVNEGELNEALANIPLLLTQARAVPYFKDGQSVGLRLFAIKPGSIFEKIGLKNGDILKNINGNSLGDITQAVQLFEKLKTEKSISVQLERNKEETEFKYSIG